MRLFKSNLTNGVNIIFNRYYIPNYLLNSVDNNYGDKRDDEILELIIHIAKEFYNHGVSDGLSKAGLDLDTRNKIRDTVFPELNNNI